MYSVQSLLDKIKYFRSEKKATNAITFMIFVLNMHQKLSTLDNRYILFLDNLSAHKTRQFLALFSKLGLKMLFNAPYTVSVIIINRNTSFEVPTNQFSPRQIQ